MKTILHLCADLGSDSQPYADAGYNVIRVGKDVGVENFKPPSDIFGVIANPPCIEFTTARYDVERDPSKGLAIVNRCMDIIAEVRPTFWVMENPATGKLKDHLGPPVFVYQPWEFGSPWTKRTALWGSFNIPKKLYTRWEDVPKIAELYTRPGRPKPSVVSMHVGHKKFIREFDQFQIKTDADFRSLCSQGFAKSFFEANSEINENRTRVNNDKSIKEVL